MRRRLGIDLSHHNGRWTLGLCSPAVEFVIHKATEGATFRDKAYVRHRVHAASSTMVWGAYHVLRETSTVEEQAANYLTHAMLDVGDLAALDLETQHIKALVAKYGAEGARGFVLRWLNAVHEATGARPLLYCSERGLKHLSGHWKEPLAELLAWPLWWVDYVDWEPPWSSCTPRLSSWAGCPTLDDHGPTSSPTGTALLWQATSRAPGKWAGCTSEHVDVNVLLGEMKDLHAITVPPTIKPLPDARTLTAVEVDRALMVVSRRLANRGVDWELLTDYEDEVRKELEL